jgi:transcriptional regulator with XRE-family HTH domain
VTGNELSATLKQIGWPISELVDRLQIRPDTVMQWLRGRRTIPDNVAAWLIQVRDKLDEAPALPEGWER